MKPELKKTKNGNGKKIKINWLHVFFVLFPFALLLISKYYLDSNDYFTYSALACGILAFLYFILVDYAGKRTRSSGKPDLTESSRNRTFLTIWIVTAGLIIIVIFGLILVGNFCVNDANCIETAESTFNVIVPIIASWIGTVLAFYFGRENFESATDRILQLSKESLEDIPIEQMMISKKTMLYLKLKDSELTISGGKKLESVKEVIELYEGISKDRIPILDNNDNPLHIIHLSVLKESSKDVKEGTLISFLEGNKGLYGYNKPKGFITVKPNLSLEDATTRRLGLKDCRDIIITSDGTASSEVLGWVPDSTAVRFLNLKKQ